MIWVHQLHPCSLALEEKRNYQTERYSGQGLSLSVPPSCHRQTAPCVVKVFNLSLLREIACSGFKTCLFDLNRRNDESERARGVPDNLNQFTHVDVVWHKELGLIQDRKLLFSFITLNDHLQGKHRQDQPLKQLFFRDDRG